METIELRREGRRPVRFEGETLVWVDGQRNGAGKDHSRWHELTVYRTAGGKYVLEVGYRSLWGDELDRSTVHWATGPAELEDVLRSHMVVPDGVGYPPGPAHAAKQARLEADLRSRFDALVADLFARLGGEFAEVIP